MIVSHARKFIFIKTYKTAGSSLEIVLSKYCGREDILARLQPDEEEARQRAAGIGARNFGKPWRRYRAEDVIRLARKGMLADRFLQHSPAFKVRQLVGEEVWNSYFKFTVVRHPFDRCLSRYYFTKWYEEDIHQLETWDRSSFDQFLRYRVNMINENWGMYTVQDRPILDFFVRYEAMEEGLAEVSRRIGLDHNLFDDLRSVRVKTSQRSRQGDEPMTDAHRALIAQLCRPEMEMFGYLADGRTAGAPMVEPPLSAVAV